MEYYLLRDDKVLGPLSDEKIQAMYGMGKLSGDVKISLDQRNWQPLSNFVNRGTKAVTTPPPVTFEPEPVYQSNNMAPPRTVQPVPVQSLNVRNANNVNVFTYLFSLNFIGDCLKLLFTPSETVEQIKIKYDATGAWAACLFYYLLPVVCTGYFFLHEFPEVGKDSTIDLLSKLALHLGLFIGCSIVPLLLTTIVLKKSDESMVYSVLSCCGVATYLPIGSLICYLGLKYMVKYHSISLQSLSQNQIFLILSIISFIILFCLISGVLFIYGGLSKIYKVSKSMIVPAISFNIIATYFLLGFVIAMLKHYRQF